MIAAAAKQAPESIKTLVFVAAYRRGTGTLMSLAQRDPDAKIEPQLRIDHDKAIAVVDCSARAELFRQRRPRGLKAKLPDLILDEPLAPLARAVQITDARFGQIDKVYVHTSLDQVISPAFQARMVEDAPVRNTVTPCGRATWPFLTDRRPGQGDHRAWPD